MVDEVMFESNSTEWGTPLVLVQALARLFGAFELDPCCRLVQYAKAPRYYDSYGLEREWDGAVFCNPPWSKTKPIDAWVQKAVESRHPVTMLVPSRTDTRWFRNVMEHAEIIAFIQGRLRYEILESEDERVARYAKWADDVQAAAGNEKRLKQLGKKPSDGTTAPFPSCVAHFSKRPARQQIGLISTEGEVLL